MKNLPFLQELVEARMFYNISDVKGKSADDLAGIVYMIIMMIEVIRNTTPQWAATYASQTLQYNTYENMHYAATDLANLLAVLNNQDTFASAIKVNSKIAIPLYQINRYLKAVSSRSNSKSDDTNFFWRLEDFLRLYSNSAFRQMRRDIGNWDELSYADKNRIVQVLRREMDKKSSSIDIYLWLKQHFKLDKE